MANTTITLGTIIQPRGVYASTKTYYKENLVTYNGKVYRCKATQTSSLPTTSDWEVFVEVPNTQIESLSQSIARTNTLLDEVKRVFQPGDSGKTYIETANRDLVIHTNELIAQAIGNNTQGRVFIHAARYDTDPINTLTREYEGVTIKSDSVMNLEADSRIHLKSITGGIQLTSLQAGSGIELMVTQGSYVRMCKQITASKTTSFGITSGTDNIEAVLADRSVFKVRAYGVEDTPSFLSIDDVDFTVNSPRCNIHGGNIALSGGLFQVRVPDSQSDTAIKVEQKGNGTIEVKLRSSISNNITLANGQTKIVGNTLFKDGDIDYASPIRMWNIVTTETITE